MSYLDDEERQLRSRLAALHREYLERAEPITHRLAQIAAMRPPMPIIVEVKGELPQCIVDILDVAPNPKPDPRAIADKVEREYARESKAKHGKCMNYPGCGCKIQHGYDCIPF
ncbi:hypothetical protein vBPaeMUSP18_07 [Pseudomonas phage vB_PaeM_USP_18]|nr:hypothetical protein vBPaeMUSP18_07 [Pseudomonas phage vB_PaeM_USP_18]QLI49513.1 hypothetical protein vBPaeMUSP25_07 [Pseudomonas phage vB_PaeM_USP_25]